MDIGRCAGKDAWDEASSGEQEAMKQASRDVWEEVLVTYVLYCLIHPEQVTEADQEAIKEAGRDVWENAMEQEREERRKAGRDAFNNLDGRQQFGRLPFLNVAGETYYLDLLVWRANKR